MTRPVGTVIVHIGVGTSATALKSLVSKAKVLTPEGRCLSVVIPLPTDWAKQKPYEALTTSCVLGAAKERVGEPKWLFSGNVTVRLCKVVKGERQVIAELLVLMYRRSGEMSYKRRQTAGAEVVLKSTIAVEHAVFTRDVANNVWHLLERNHSVTLRRRISMLHTWSDEDTLVVSDDGVKAFRHQVENLNNAIIGVPTKRSYLPTTWGQQVLFPS